MLKNRKLQAFFFFKEKQLMKRVNYGSSQDDIDSVTGGSSPCLLQGGGAHTGVGAGLWFLSNAWITQHFCKMPQSSTGRPQKTTNPKIPRAQSWATSTSWSVLWVQQLVTVVSKDPLSKPIICIYRHPLRGDVLWEKKSQSQNIWPHGNRQWQGIFLHNETWGLIHVHRNSHNSTETA